MSTVMKRGFGKIDVLPGGCLCFRPQTNVICHICGYVGWARLRYACPKHPKTIFLTDIEQCPTCKSHSFRMSEFSCTRVSY